MPGYAVRVPTRFTTPKFCRFFTCGAFSKKETIAGEDPLTTIGHLSDRVSNVERLAEEKRIREEQERQRREVLDRPETTPKITDEERIQVEELAQEQLERAWEGMVDSAGEYTEEELERMVQHLMANPDLTDSIRIIWSQNCTPTQRRQLAAKEEEKRRAIQAQIDENHVQLD